MELKVGATTKRTGSEVKTPQPRKLRASKPATPPSKRASAAGPPSLYAERERAGVSRSGRGRAWAGVGGRGCGVLSFCSGASAM